MDLLSRKKVKSIISPDQETHEAMIEDRDWHKKKFIHTAIIYSYLILTPSVALSSVVP